MDRSRPHPAQLAVALAGILLAVVGLVRLGQGRPERTRAVAATTVAGGTASAGTPSADTTASGASSSGASSSGTSAVAVDIVDFLYAPDPLDVAVGTSVTWTNKDSFAHTATATAKTAGAPFDSENLAEGESYSYTFDKPGTFTYLCAIHNSMTGTVVVQ